MIRVYFALCLLALSGVALISTDMPVLELAGFVEVVAAVIALHAHYHGRVAW